MSSGSEVEVEALRAQLEEARLEAARERAKARTYATEIKSLKEQNLSAHNKVGAVQLLNPVYP
jgi:cytochrome b